MSDVPADNPRALLQVSDLRTYFDTDEGVVRAVDGIGFDVHAGETFAIVGESGSGKTVTALSLLALLPKTARIVSGSIRLDERELVGLPPEEMRAIRGAEIAMIFQDALTALNPVFSIGNQIIEAILQHESMSKEQARDRAIHLLERVGIPEPARRVDQFPHELSGGMRQRAMIAVALSCQPRILIADEPTTALDVTIQAQILSLMNDLRRDLGSSIILITHDLAVVAEMADTVAVMYGGRKVEHASVDDLFASSAHPYTWGLLRSLPRLDQGRHEQKLIPIPGTPPSLINLPAGCHFHPRCRFAQQVCCERYPELREIHPGHWSACHFAETLVRDVEPATDASRSSRAGGCADG